MTRSGMAGLLLCISIGLGAPMAHAVTAAESFADGNRLFRDDLYWAALLRYRQAAEAGMDKPLLHYNTGVAHYKAGQYGRAHQALLKAARSSRLRVLSHYNLGINAYAAGNNDEALRWLRQARDQEESIRLHDLAVRAIARIRRAETRADPVVVQVRKMQEAKKFTELDLYARAGFGSDNNVYRSPSAPYISRSNPNRPVLVNPIVQSGTFMPVSVGAKYSINSFENESFFGRYRLDGRFYQNSDLKNADEFVHEFAFGTEYRRKLENRESIISSAFTFAQHKETYFDPDDGIARSRNGVDIGDRLSYLRYGPEIMTRQSWRKFSFNLWAKAQLWNYEKTQEVPEYDHEYFRVGSRVQYKFTRTSLLRLTAELYQRNFSDRPAFELDGSQPLGNPTVKYDYIKYGIQARQRISSFMWFGVTYLRTERSDGYVGYNDYTRDGYRAEFSLRAGQRFRLRASATYRVYNFTNAFAYNNPAAGRRTMETLRGGLTASYVLAWNLTLVGDYAYREIASNDARIDYDRSLYSLSLRWNYD